MRVREGAGKSEADGGWRTVARRQYGSTGITSFFISGFPDGSTSGDLWAATEKLGKITESFVPRRKRFNNDNFGFIRFKGVVDIEGMVSQLCNVVMGGRKVVANVSVVPRHKVMTAPIVDNGFFGRFQEKAWVPYGKEPVPVNRAPIFPAESVLSFHEALTGEAAKAGVEGVVGKVMKRVVLPAMCSDYPSSFMARSLVGITSDRNSLLMQKLCLWRGVSRTVISPTSEVYQLC